MNDENLFKMIEDPLAGLESNQWSEDDDEWDEEK